MGNIQDQGRYGMWGRYGMGEDTVKLHRHRPEFVLMKEKTDFFHRHGMVFGIVQ